MEYYRIGYNWFFHYVLLYAATLKSLFKKNNAFTMFTCLKASEREGGRERGEKESEENIKESYLYRKFPSTVWLHTYLQWSAQEGIGQSLQLRT